MLLAQKLEKYDLILASQSPRRQQLLSDLGLKFRVLVKEGIDEIYPDNLSNTEIAVYLAKLKAKNYKSELNVNGLLITADTIVCQGTQVLNKPKNKEEAHEMLQLLSDNKHEVITGVCLKTSKQERCFFAKTKVYFKELTEDEINYYISHYQPYDKAGSYGIQEWIGFVGITKIEGSYFNVMGLPVQLVYEKLNQFVSE